MKTHLEDRAWKGVFFPVDLVAMKMAIESAKRDFDPHNLDSSLRYAMVSAILLAYEDGLRDPDALYEAAARVARVILRATRNSSNSYIHEQGSVEG